MPIIEKDKDADLGLCQDGFGSNKRGETEQYCGLRYGGCTAEYPPINLNEKDRAMGQQA